MRRTPVFLLGLVMVLTAGAAVPALGGVAHASATAKTYNDPWLDGDLEQMRVPEALDILARTPQHVVVGDIDSGARLTDPDLAPHLMQMGAPHRCASVYGPGPSYSADPADGDYGCDFIGDGSEATPSTDPDGDPTDTFGHGTATAEIIAGVDNNGTGGAGVAPNARVLPVRACYGGNPDCLDEPLVAGMAYAVDLGATVVNVPAAPGTSSALGSYVHGEPNVLFVFTIGASDANSDPYALCTDKERAQLLLVTSTGRQLRVLKVVNAAQRRTVRGEAQGTNSIDATVKLPRGTYHVLVRVLGTPVNTGAPSRILTVTVR